MCLRRQRRTASLVIFCCNHCRRGSPRGQCTTNLVLSLPSSSLRSLGLRPLHRRRRADLLSSELSLHDGLDALLCRRTFRQRECPVAVVIVLLFSSSPWVSTWSSYNSFVIVVVVAVEVDVAVERLAFVFVVGVAFEDAVVAVQPRHDYALASCHCCYFRTTG